MSTISFTDLQGRVLVTRERVKFADADPYGHLSSGAYVNLIMSHRVEALQDHLGFSIVQSARSGVAYPARHIDISFLRPAFVGDELEVGSWLESLGTSSLEVRAIVVGGADRKARAVARIRFVTVDATSGRSVSVPADLDVTHESNPTTALPLLADYLGKVTGLPDGFAPI